MAAINEIQFIDLDTGAPIVTISGNNAMILLENSELIQTVLEIGDQANPNVLVVPIGDMGLGRQQLFANILRGVPVGKRNRWNTVTYYPLGPEEERNIARVMNERNGGAGNRNTDLTLERGNAIFETMRYLLIPDELIQDMLIFDEDNERPEFTMDDEIEQMLHTHRKWLYITGQAAKLTPSELEEAKEFFDEIEEQYKRDLEELERLGKENQKRRAARFQRSTRSRRAYSRHRFLNNSNNNSNNSNNDNYLNYRNEELNDEYRQATNPRIYEPPLADTTGGMTVRELERWLRTVYFKKKPLELNTLHLNTLFNENRRANRGRVNRPTVIYYNESGRNNNNKTRKAKKNNKKKPNNGNGSAW